jgi:hypothetical protein
MPETLVKKETRDLQDYENAKTALEELFAHSRLEAQAALRPIRIRTAWEAGKIIDTHVLFHQERANYAGEAIKKFATHLKLNKPRELYYSLEFFRAYPILPSIAKLGLTHFRQLLTVNRYEIRDKLTCRADREGWSVSQLRSYIRKHRLGGRASKQLTPPKPRTRLLPKRGKIGHYQIVDQVSSFANTRRVVVDFGFKNREELNHFTNQEWEPGTIIEMVHKPTTRFEKRPDATKRDLYTYRAEVFRAVDGDTVLVNLELAGRWQEEKLRLRGIDAPELKTEAGRRAKAFVEKTLKNVTAITVTTSRTEEKWGRYVSDVFLGDTYLNQLIVDAGHARIMS